MNSQYPSVYEIDGVKLRKITNGDTILPDDKNNMNYACMVIKNKIGEKLKTYSMMVQ